MNIMEAHEDVLCYSTPILEKAVEVTGAIELVLYVSSSARDTDFTGKLVDVYPGRVHSTGSSKQRDERRGESDRTRWVFHM